MENILVFSGIGLICAGAILGLIVVAIGYKEEIRQAKRLLMRRCRNISPPRVPLDKLARLDRVWSFAMTAGFIVLGVGVII